MANNQSPKYTDLQCASLVDKYFTNFRSGQIQSGFELFCATDGENCMFVNPSYQPDPDDENIRIFRCEVRKGSNGRSDSANNGITLVWPRTDETEDQLWRAFEKFCATPPYYKKNGIIYHNGKQQTPVDNAWLKSVIREVMAEMESETSNS